MGDLRDKKQAKRACKEGKAMLRAIVISIVGLILGMLLISYVILPIAADLLARPDIATWTGLGAGLHILGIVLLGSLFVGYLWATYKAARGDDD